ncbi:MAG: hypothetical protein SF069_19250 [Phycisphaerae bacterium]|nr:hypothetical protein [Phycisphaerae bacterium]
MTQPGSNPAVGAGRTAADRKLRLMIAIIAGVAAVAAGANYVLQQTMGMNRRTEFTLMSLDVAARTAKIEVVLPKNGKRITLSAEVPADCEIYVDGVPAAMSEIRVGDRGEAEGVIYRTGKLIAKRVAVTRSTAGATTSAGAAPTSAPAADRPPGSD